MPKSMEDMNHLPVAYVFPGTAIAGARLAPLGRTRLWDTLQIHWTGSAGGNVTVWHTHLLCISLAILPSLFPDANADGFDEALVSITASLPSAFANLAS